MVNTGQTIAHKITDRCLFVAQQDFVPSEEREKLALTQEIAPTLPLGAFSLDD